MRDCQTAEGEWNDDLRSARGCTLGPPHAHVVQRRPTAAALLTPAFGSAYRGRYPDRTVTTVLGFPVNYERLPEPPEDGCPGAWYRTAFIDSIDKYSRRRTEGGGRVPNPRFDEAVRAGNGLIQEAILYLEDEESRAIAYAIKVADDRAEAERKKRENNGHRR